MQSELIQVRVPGHLKFIHFVNDTGELLFKSHISFYTEELLNYFVQDMRIIMYELYSNAVNHSKSDTVEIEFVLSEDTISVTFLTNNIPYGIKQVDKIDEQTKEHPVIIPPFKEHMIGSQCIVYRDIQNEVICDILGEYELAFHHRKNVDFQKEVKEIPEHYGLNLITKLAHTATYHRNEQGVDCFTITKRIR